MRAGGEGDDCVVGGHGCWVVVEKEGFVVVLMGRLLRVDEGGLVRRKKIWRVKGRLSRGWGRERVSCARAVERIHVVDSW